MDFTKKQRKEIIKNLKKEYAELVKSEEDKLTLGQKIADSLTAFGGSWTFIIALFMFIVGWMLLNTYCVLFFKWDPYPFILLNLFLSFLAAFQAPVILMSQNREAERDRKKAEEDYIINKMAELEVADMQNDLEIIKHKIDKLAKELERHKHSKKK